MKRVISLRSQVPLLDVVSYARGRVLSPEQHAYIARTVRRVPEVLVKVSGGARTLAGVERHMKYIEKKGALGLETDMGTRAGGDYFAHRMVSDWDLDIEALRRYEKRYVRGKPPKLVHNIVFSMPAGTSAKKVLLAVRKLALNEWALQHRYAMALHTDTPHPHVHVVVKAVSEQGVRLNIKKAHGGPSLPPIYASWVLRQTLPSGPSGERLARRNALPFTGLLREMTHLTCGSGEPRR